MKPIAILIPESINIEDLVDVYAPNLNLDIDYLNYLIHFISSKQSDYNNAKYVSISSQKLLVRNGKHKEHIAFLCSKEVNVLKRRNYSIGKCYSYCLSPQHQNKRLAVHYIKPSKLANKIINSETKPNTILTSNNSKYHYLNKFFDSSKLTIEIDLAIEFCNKRFEEHRDYKKYCIEMTKLVELYNGEFKIHYTKDTDGRLHTNITSLPKVYRQFINYNNKPLIEVDLSNSIIYFLAITIKHYTNKDIMLKEDIIKQVPLLYMFSKSLKTIDNKEVELLWELAINGEFYSYFIPDLDKLFSYENYKTLYEKENNKEYTGTVEQKKKVAKNQILSMLFAETKHFKNIQQIFKSKFPNILQSINEFKTANGYEKFSHLLFQVESYVMLGIVGKEFNHKHYKKAPTLTLHDCLITTLRYGKELLESMKMSFINCFGQAPKMVLQEW